MNFASAKQIVILVVVVVIVCYALDYYMNPQLWHHENAMNASTGKGARLTLHINHLCCADCLSDTRQALAALPGIDPASISSPKQLLTREQADQSTASLADYASSIELIVSDPDKVDLVAMDKVLRDKGMVAGRMELSGLEHFRLAAKVEHLCCGMCARAAPERVAFLRARAQSGQLRWIDSVTVDRDAKTIVAYARYLQAGKAIDVTEFLGALSDSGYAPRSVQIIAHEEEKAAAQRAHDAARLSVGMSTIAN